MLPKAELFVASTVLAHGSANNGVFGVKSVARRNALSVTPLALGLIRCADAQPRPHLQGNETPDKDHKTRPRMPRAPVSG